MLSVRRIWRSLPKKIRSTLRYIASRVPHYTEMHRSSNFAGNLEQLKVAYAASTPEAKADLSDQFDSIVDQLTMPNGVTKTTYSKRLASSLSAVLSAIKLTRSEIQVLDFAGLSTGHASLQCFAQLQETYRVISYVLGDMYHTVLYDPHQKCIFDEKGYLLDLPFKRLFLSIYRVGVLGDRYTFLTAVWHFPTA